MRTGKLTWEVKEEMWHVKEGGGEDMIPWNIFEFCVRDHSPNDFGRQGGREC